MSRLKKSSSSSPSSLSKRTQYFVGTLSLYAVVVFLYGNSYLQNTGGAIADTEALISDAKNAFVVAGGSGSKSNSNNERGGVNNNNDIDIDISLPDAPRQQRQQQLRSISIASDNNNNNNNNFTHETSFTPPPATPFPHVVFIGDSLLRYSYLAWLHEQHHYLLSSSTSTTHDDDAPILAPKTLINEKLSDSWHSFFVNSTAHFGGHMKCDCRRSQEFSLGKEVENRYYYYHHRNRNHKQHHGHRDATTGLSGLAATYIQAYGDNQAHGRYLPEDVWSSAITDGNDTAPYKWGYMGRDGEWSGLITDYVAKLWNTTPTLMVFNAGFWPNERTAHHLGSIFRAAKEVMGPHGRVIWKGITPTRGTSAAPRPSASDRMAREWSYRYPWLTYRAFDAAAPIAEEETELSSYFDDKYFADPRTYRRWNRDIALRPPLVHRAFLLVGGVRTSERTRDSLLRNLVHPVCAPPGCVAHLIVHLSRADNRPMEKGDDDPSGVVVVDVDDAVDPEQQRNGGEEEDGHFFTDNAATNLFPDGFLIVHRVDGYEIGSREEQAAMDEAENETEDPRLARRLRLFRRGDPRRYSMWFARAHAWRFAKKLSVGFDFFVFCRPDMLWMMPAPSKAFFDEFGANKTRDVWVHSTYYSDTADTFAFLPSVDVADVYFDLSYLVKDGVACLGGPNFNQSLVKTRLARENIATVDSDWCAQENNVGWSEKILRRRLRRSQIDIRYINAAATILRPPATPLCEVLGPEFASGYATIPKSHIPVLACLMTRLMITEGRPVEDWLLRPQRLRGKKASMWPLCLTFNETNGTLDPMQCREFPHPPEQLFAQDDGGRWFRFRNARPKQYDIVPLASESQQLLKSGDWEAENVELYSTEGQRQITR